MCADGFCSIFSFRFIRCHFNRCFQLAVIYHIQHSCILDSQTTKHKVKKGSDTLITTQEVKKSKIHITFRIYSLCDDPTVSLNRDSIMLFLAATVVFDLLILNHCMCAS